MTDIFDICQRISPVIEKLVSTIRLGLYVKSEDQVYTRILKHKNVFVIALFHCLINIESICIVF